MCVENVVEGGAAGRRERREKKSVASTGAGAGAAATALVLVYVCWRCWPDWVWVSKTVVVLVEGGATVTVAVESMVVLKSWMQTLLAQMHDGWELSCVAVVSDVDAVWDGSSCDTERVV